MAFRYVRTILHLWWIIAVDVVSAAAGILLIVFADWHIPAWLWVLVGLGSVIAAQVFAYRELWKTGNSHVRLRLIEGTTPLVILYAHGVVQIIVRLSRCMFLNDGDTDVEVLGMRMLLKEKVGLRQRIRRRRREQWVIPAVIPNQGLIKFRLPPRSPSDEMQLQFEESWDTMKMPLHVEVILDADAIGVRSMVFPICEFRREPWDTSIGNHLEPTKRHLVAGGEVRPIE